MNFLAIPIGLNGLIKPANLGIVPDAETEALKASFSRTDSFDFILKMDGKRLQAISPYASAKAMRSMVSRFENGLQPFLKAGATMEDGTVLVLSDHLKAGELQIDTAGPMHIDHSARLYESGLAEDRIAVRGLWVSEQSPIICDVSQVVNPLASISNGCIQQEDEQKYRAAGLVHIPAERAFMLMDPVTPHAARPVLNETHRLLIDFRAKLKLPADWRMRAQHKLCF